MASLLGLRDHARDVSVLRAMGLTSLQVRAVLARLLGIHITVAAAWQRASAGDWSAYAALGMLWVGGAIVFYGIFSEVVAVYALYQQQAESSSAETVLSGTILMVIATAAGPALAYLRAILRAAYPSWPPGIQRWLAGVAGIGQPRAAPTSASGTEPSREPETGKTDPEQ